MPTPYTCRRPWGVIEIIEPLERELGVKVITATQAIIWETLRRSGVTDRINGYGRCCANTRNPTRSPADPGLDEPLSIRLRADDS